MFGQDMQQSGGFGAAPADDSTPVSQASYVDGMAQAVSDTTLTDTNTVTTPATDSVGDYNAATPLTHNESEAIVQTSDVDDLLAIKQLALNDLSPLVSQLDQSPEEKFKTTMMMIQASDDHTLVATAYEAARGIEDEEVRAHALLDIVNEINYFTSHAD